jgi:hypothetical protein
MLDSLLHSMPLTLITPRSYAHSTDHSASTTNGFNIGALMEKGVRLIGNGQGWLAGLFAPLDIALMLGLHLSSCPSLLAQDPQGL